MTYYDEEHKPLTQEERSGLVMKVKSLGKICIWSRCCCRFDL